MGSRPFTGAWIETDDGIATAVEVSVAPSRGRGLKPVTLDLCDPDGRRPFTGAWIETATFRIQGWSVRRPFTGAWIETGGSNIIMPKDPVAPSRGRGLKQAVDQEKEVSSESPLHGGVD